MIVSIINGSPRKTGATTNILKRFANELNNFSELQTYYYNLSSLDMCFCRGCQNCYSTGYCTIKSDNLADIFELIKKSDAIIIGSPTHGSNISAVLKNFIDRGHFILEQSLYKKNCISVITYEIADGQSAKKILNKFFIVSGGTVANTLLVKTGFNKNPNTAKVDKKIVDISKRFYKAIKSKRKRTIFEYIFNDVIVVRTIWKTFFKNNPNQFTGVINKYKKKNIHNCLTKHF